MQMRKITHGARVVGRDLRAIVKRELDFYRVRPGISTLFLTYRCDSKCKTCTRWQMPQEELIGQELEFEGWKTVIDKLAAAGIRVTEVFGGNVLLRKDLLIKVLAYLHHKGISIHLPTNQLGLDDEVAEAFARYVDTVYVSTDGLPQQQNEIRGKEEAAQKVEQAITLLTSARTRLGPCANPVRLVCNCTVSRFNADILEDLADYALEKGFDEIHYEYAGEFLPQDVENTNMNGVVPDPHYIRQDRTILVDKDTATRVKASLRRVKQKLRDKALTPVTINIDTRSERSLWSGQIPHGRCYVMRNEVTVDPAGRVVVCPFITNVTFGDLVTESFADIWNNSQHKEFRRLHGRGEMPMCSTCILGVERNPGIKQSLKRIYFNRIESLLWSFGGR